MTWNDILRHSKAVRKTMQSRAQHRRAMQGGAEQDRAVLGKTEQDRVGQGTAGKSNARQNRTE